MKKLTPSRPPRLVLEGTGPAAPNDGVVAVIFELPFDSLTARIQRPTVSWKIFAHLETYGSDFNQTFLRSGDATSVLRHPQRRGGGWRRTSGGSAQGAQPHAGETCWPGPLRWQCGPRGVSPSAVGNLRKRWKPAVAR